MKCDRCGESVAPEEVREIHGQRVCEDCYMDLLSPARPCDPWAAMAAKSASQLSEGEESMTETQHGILDILGRGPLTLEDLARKSNLGQVQLERELATLHRMEKIGANLENGQRKYRLWTTKDEDDDESAAGVEGA